MTKKIDKKLILDVVSAFARFYMAYIWIKAGVAKLGEPLSVMQSIKAYEIFTLEWSGYLANIIGPLEIIGGVLARYLLHLPHGVDDGASVQEVCTPPIVPLISKTIHCQCHVFSDGNAQCIGYILC